AVPYPHPSERTLSAYTTLFRSREEADPKPTLNGGAHDGHRIGDDARRKPPARLLEFRLHQRHDHPAIGEHGNRMSRAFGKGDPRSEEHTSELQSRENLVCRLLL